MKVLANISRVVVIDLCQVNTYNLLDKLINMAYNSVFPYQQKPKKPNPSIMSSSVVRHASWGYQVEFGFTCLGNVIN